jgi:hypothetical protein
VLGEFQLHRSRLVLTFDLDLLAHDLHWHPRVVKLGLVWIGWVRLFDIRVHLVGAGEGHAPPHILVIAQVHPNKWRLASADHVPTWGVELHKVSQ